MKEQAEKFGVGKPLDDPDVGGQSDFGPQEDKAALAQASIGQRSNQMTPLQMAMVAAGIANDGTVMKPYLVNKIADPERRPSSRVAEPEELTEAVSPETAGKLTRDDGQRRAARHRPSRRRSPASRGGQDRHRGDRSGPAPARLVHLLRPGRRSRRSRSRSSWSPVARAATPPVARSAAPIATRS